MPREDSNGALETAFDRQLLSGFGGFVPVDRLIVQSHPGELKSLVRDESGVYAVVRARLAEPQFLRLSAAGRFKGKDPGVPIERLHREWVAGTQVLYVGKAALREDGTALASRLTEYIRFAAGNPIGHWGGRLVWQLADWKQLLLAWCASEDQDPEEEEGRVLASFELKFDRLPFANLRRTPSQREWLRRLMG